MQRISAYVHIHLYIYTSICNRWVVLAFISFNFVRLLLLLLGFAASPFMHLFAPSPCSAQVFSSAFPSALAYVARCNRICIKLPHYNSLLPLAATPQRLLYSLTQKKKKMYLKIIKREKIRKKHNNNNKRSTQQTFRS